MGLGLLGIIFALLLFMVLAYRGFNLYIAAPLCAVIVAVTNSLDPIEAFSSTYVNGMLEVFASLFSIIFLGAILGKVFTDTGCAISIAQTLIKTFVSKKSGDAQVRIALLVVLIMSGLCTMGGIDGYILTFTMFPICMLIAEMVDIPRRFVGGMLVLNCGFMAAPGAPQINNVMAQAALAQEGHFVGAATAVVPGFIAVIFIVVCGYLTLSALIIRAKRSGEYFEYGSCPKFSQNEERQLPHFVVSIIPLITVFVIYTVFNLNIAIALLAGIIVNLILAGRYIERGESSLFTAIKDSLGKGANGYPNAMLTVVTPSGLAAVITATAAFQGVVGLLFGIHINPVFLVLIAVCVVVALTSSPPVALMVAIPVVLQVATVQDVNVNALARVGAIAATTFETLPVNGLIILTLGLTGCTHKESYFPMFMQSVIFTLLGAILCAVLLMLFPGLA